MKVTFKQRTISDKIRVYDALIVKWVEMRNFIIPLLSESVPRNIPPQAHVKFDQIYGESQRLIGEAILVCEDIELTDSINTLNERLYRTEWLDLPWEQANATMEEIKKDAIPLIARMRGDIKDSTRFEWQDFRHMASGFRKGRNAAASPTPRK